MCVAAFFIFYLIIFLLPLFLSELFLAMQDSVKHNLYEL